MDKKLANTEARSQQQEEQLKRRRQKHVAEAEATTSEVQLEGSSSSAESREDPSTSADSDKGQKKATPQTRRFRPNNVWTPELTAALDWTGTMDRNALFVVAETARSLGHDPGELNITLSSVKCHREKHRQQQWTDLHNAFKAKGKKMHCALG